MRREMPPRPQSLPDFDDPPLIEVAASLQFPAILALDAAQLGILWLRFRDRYPKTEVQPALPRVVESEATPASQQFQISVMGNFPGLRFWFLTEDGTRVVQVQNDRLVVNWRRLESAAPYPRFPQIRHDLTTAFDEVVSFLKDQNFDATPTIDQAELTYVNHFWAGDLGAPRAPISRFLRHAWEFAGSVLPAEPEDISLRARFAMKEPVPGRVYVEVGSAQRAIDRASIYSMSLTARGAPIAPTLDGALAFMDTAHSWIVNTFAELTTEEMHRLWKRRI